MQRQAFGVQHKARKFAGFSCGIDRVAQDRVAKRQHMHPQLVAAACQGEQMHPRLARIPPQNHPIRYRCPAIDCINHLARAVGPIGT